ncbi:MAG: PEP-CTERM sorting domain-containing protein [Phycisphaerae bacterium]|nr:PEP-CTERM sorting domain-containing protein [Phycisphaerae bacterium]
MLRSCAVAVGLLLFVSPTMGELIITDTIPGTFVDISGTGTALGLDDNGAAEVFCNFDLAQTIFSGGGGQAFVRNDGVIGFATSSLDSFSNLTTENFEIPNYMMFPTPLPPGSHEPLYRSQALAVYWDDLDATTGNVYYDTIGEPGSQVFIVQWQDRPHSPGDAVLDGNEATFQVQIFENEAPGYAQFLYQDVTFGDPTLNDGASATIGYQAQGMSPENIGDCAGCHDMGKEGPQVRDETEFVQWSHNMPGAVHAGDVLTLVPEPGTLGLMIIGAGLCGTGLYRWRRR